MTSYTPVAYDYRELIEEAIAQKTEGKVFFFNERDQLDDVEGQVVAMFEDSAKGVFIQLDPLAHVRIDRIITLFGKPGAACDEYYALGETCLTCLGGYDHL